MTFGQNGYRGDCMLKGIIDSPLSKGDAFAETMHEESRG